MKEQLQNNSILSQIFSAKNTPERTIFFYKNQKINLEKFQKFISFFAEKISKIEKEKWCIYCEDIFLFSVGFLALLQAGKKIIIIPNIQFGNLKNFADISEAILSDIDLAESPLFHFKISDEVEINDAKITLKNINATNQITFFTSGSSGNPKEITKSLEQLEAEILCFEELFGKNIEQQTIFASTVTHQHIYGFLFRFFWPIYRENIIYNSTILTAEDLEKITQNHKILLISSPAFLKRLTSEQISSGNISQIFSSGGLLKKSDAQNVAAIFNGNFPIEILGSTETGGVAWRNQKENENWNILPKVQIKITDDGQLTVKSPFSHQEDYIKMGDTAQLIGANQFLLKERIDKIVKIEEKRISLTEVENRLAEHEFIKNSHAVILQEGRQIIAVIIELNAEGKKFLEENDKLTLNRILKKYLAQYFEAITLPRKWRYVATIPVNSTGKILKSEIEKLI